MNFLRHMKISRKLTLSFSILVAVTLLMAVVSFSAIQDIKSAEAENQKANLLGSTFRLFDESFNDQREGLLYYLLTGDRNGLKQYNEAALQGKKAMKDLMQYSKGNESVFALVNQLALYHKTWTNEFASQQLNLMRNYLTVNQARAIEVSGLPGEVIGKFSNTAHKLAHELENIVNLTIEQKDTALTRFSTTIIVSIAILVLIAVFFGFTLTNVIAGPIGRITELMGNLAKGDLEIDVQGVDRRDEIGGMARAVEVFKKNAIEQRELQANEAKKQEAERVRHEKLEQLARDFDESMRNGLGVVAKSVGDVTESASTMAGNAVETGALSQDASVAIEEASANIQTVSSATTELSSSISEISRQMAQTSEVSRAAVDEIEKANARVSALNDAAVSIGQVVQIISDIADQTNLLALNATIESARAGEAGKGFAVVASEVKNLANQTGKATEEISQKINEIQNETGAAADAVLGIGETIRKIDELTAVVASAVEEQGAATSEIARNVDEAAQGANQVSGVVQSVAQAADETGKLAESQKNIVQELNDNNDVLKRDIDNFLSEVKSL
ncbi:MAG: HAMP domain-containing protein [Methylocystaceae bacterium]|nr:HAMP domain-containing protein [Methylocystaceae bacterium]